MTEEPRYKILQNYTGGWEAVADGVTKEQCDEILNTLLAGGINPEYLKVYLCE